MHKLIEYVCDELSEIEKKASRSGELSLGEIEYADKLAHLKKNLLKGEEMTGGMEHSYGMNASFAGGNSSGRGGSYADGSYESGSYARGRGRNAKRDSMGRYSSERGYSRAASDMAEKLRDMMDDAPDEATRQEIERIVRKVEQM